ncbi:MAG: GntG family PLP-dependent aldolase [Balneolaceae bacterium]
MVDLRSDTVTKPTPEMLDAMVRAEVGDDVFAEDPTVNEFEKKMAALFGVEAGLFVPSGTMSNQLCIKVLTEPGDEVILDATGHPFNYETGAAAHLSSVQLNPLQGKRGKLTPELIESAIRPTNYWDPRSRVVAVENSTNKGGGACYSKAELRAIKDTSDQYGLSLHMDGARIWNAMVATEIEPVFFGEISDTMSVCFSKGLGAPVGSMMLASAGAISKARRYRKMWGGGMRQVGLLAAAADYAVEHHWPYLKEDHRRAKSLAKAISRIPGFSVKPDSVETNIVLFDVGKGEVTEVLQKLENDGVGMVPFGPRTIRATFHFQVDDEGLDQAIRALERTGIA